MRMIVTQNLQHSGNYISGANCNYVTNTWLTAIILLFSERKQIPPTFSDSIFLKW